MLLGFLLRHLITKGTLRVIDAKGETHTFTGDLPGPTVTIRMHDPKLERRLYRVKARTLVLAAEHDAVLPRVHCERYAAAIEGARTALEVALPYQSYQQGPMTMGEVMSSTAQSRAARSSLIVDSLGVWVAQGFVGSLRHFSLATRPPTSTLPIGFDIRGSPQKLGSTSLHVRRLLTAFERTVPILAVRPASCRLSTRLAFPSSA